MTVATKRTCNHECFRYCCTDGASPFVFVFERQRWIKPSPEQVADYYRRKAIVEANGGMMQKADFDFLGVNPTFTQAEEQDMLMAVLRDNPDLELDKSWNGKGCYTCSVGAKLK